MIPRLLERRRQRDEEAGRGGGRTYLRVCAPMVRYSKLPFRVLVREYECDLAFTPMIVASSFNRSARARDSDFATSADPELDRPLVVQFACNTPEELAAAALRVQDVADAVDINCGCPQRKVVRGNLGAALSDQPELVRRMVLGARRVVRPGLELSVKVRVHEDVRRTVDLVRQAEAAGVSWVSVHGRTIRERRESVRYDTIRACKDAVSVPVFANGDGLRAGDLDGIVERTGADGVMCARGLLANPAMFSGAERAPVECAERYLGLALDYGGHFTIHWHHLMYMLFPSLARPDRREFSRLRSLAGVSDFFSARGWAPRFEPAAAAVAATPGAARTPP